MRTMVIVLLLMAGSFAQETIPAGTILPVQLNSSLRSNKARPGQVIRARVMQNIPLAGRAIHADATVLGYVVAVRSASNGGGAEISLRFDTVARGTGHIPVTTNLRALATMMDVSEAQIPGDRSRSRNVRIQLDHGPDRRRSRLSRRRCHCSRGRDRWPFCAQRRSGSRETSHREFLSNYLSSDDMSRASHDLDNAI